MKKILAYISLACTIICSCSKKDDHKSKPDSNLHPVTYNITNFTQQTVPVSQANKIKINATSKPIDSTSIITMVYKLYNSNNQLIKTKTSAKGDPLFGIVQDSLLTGSYTAVFVGKGPTFKDWNNNAGDVFITDNNTDFDYHKAETFYKKISFTVTDQNVQQDVILERLSAQLVVKLNDMPPAFVPAFSVIITGPATYSYLNDTPTGNLVDHQYTYNTNPNNIGQTIGPLFTNYSTTPVTVTLIAYYANGHIGAQKIINNVTLSRNTQTILTGNLYTNNSGGPGFNVSFNPVYNPDINQGF